MPLVPSLRTLAVSRERGRSARKTAIAGLLLTVLLSGCGVVYLNKADRNPEYRAETAFTSKRSSEMTYRRIYTMLYRCTSGYYRIKGSYDPDSRNGEISVDTGAGFENDLFLADSHVMKITVDADGIEKSSVRIQQTSADGAPYAGAMAGWVNDDSEDCASG